MVALVTDILNGIDVQKQAERTSSLWVTVALTTALNELLQFRRSRRRDMAGLLRIAVGHWSIVIFLCVMNPSQ